MSTSLSSTPSTSSSSSSTSSSSSSSSLSGLGGSRVVEWVLNQLVHHSPFFAHHFDRPSLLFSTHFGAALRCWLKPKQCWVVMKVSSQQHSQQASLDCHRFMKQYLDPAHTTAAAAASRGNHNGSLVIEDVYRESSILAYLNDCQHKLLQQQQLQLQLLQQTTVNDGYRYIVPLLSCFDLPLPLSSPSPSPCPSPSSSSSSSSLTSSTSSSSSSSSSPSFEYFPLHCQLYEYCNEGDLLTFLHNHSHRLSERFIKHIFTQLMKAILFMHQHGVAHVDLSLENVCISVQPKVHTNDSQRESLWGSEDDDMPDVSIRVIDFGLAILHPHFAPCDSNNNNLNHSTKHLPHPSAFPHCIIPCSSSTAASSFPQSPPSRRSRRLFPCHFTCVRPGKLAYMGPELLNSRVFEDVPLLFQPDAGVRCSSCSSSSRRLRRPHHPHSRPHHSCSSTSLSSLSTLSSSSSTSMLTSSSPLSISPAPRDDFDSCSSKLSHPHQQNEQFNISATSTPLQHYRRYTNSVSSSPLQSPSSLCSTILPSSSSSSSSSCSCPSSCFSSSTCCNDDEHETRDEMEAAVEGINSDDEVSKVERDYWCAYSNDIFSCGVILFCLLTGSRPFQQASFDHDTHHDTNSSTPPKQHLHADDDHYGFKVMWSGEWLQFQLQRRIQLTQQPAGSSAPIPASASSSSSSSSSCLKIQAALDRLSPNALLLLDAIFKPQQQRPDAETILAHPWFQDS